RMLFIRKGIPGLDVLKANGGTYVTGLYIFNGILFVGMHLVDPGNPFLVPGTVVQYIGTGIQMSGIDPEEGQTPHEGIGCDLESQSRKGLLDTGFSADLLLGVRVNANNGILVHRGRKITADT